MGDTQAENSLPRPDSVHLDGGLEGTIAPGATTRVNPDAGRADAHRSSDQVAGLSQRSPCSTNGSSSRSNDASVAPREMATAARHASSIALRSERRDA